MVVADLQEPVNIKSWMCLCILLIFSFNKPPNDFLYVMNFECQLFFWCLTIMLSCYEFESPFLIFFRSHTHLIMTRMKKTAKRTEFAGIEIKETQIRKYRCKYEKSILVALGTENQKDLTSYGWCFICIVWRVTLFPFYLSKDSCMKVLIGSNSSWKSVHLSSHSLIHLPTCLITCRHTDKKKCTHNTNNNIKEKRNSTVIGFQGGEHRFLVCLFIYGVCIFVFVFL